MIGKVLNLPFKVLGGVARAVQAQEAKKRSNASGGPAEDRDEQGIDIQVPEDFDAGPIHLPASEAVKLTGSKCILDATKNGAGIPEALHIPAREMGIRIAELPPDTTIVVISQDTEESDQVIRFLRHRGLDETWSLDGGIHAWKSAGGEIGSTT